MVMVPQGSRMNSQSLSIPVSGNRSELTGLQKHVSLYMLSAAGLCGLCSALVKSPLSRKNIYGRMALHHQSRHGVTPDCAAASNHGAGNRGGITVDRAPRPADHR